MIIKILLGLLVLALAFIVVVSLRPAAFRIERTATIDAPPRVVFDEVNSFHRMEAWSPWAKLDPSMKTRFSGPDSGEGATYEYTGNGKVGEGRLVIEQSRPYERIRYHQEFRAPMKAVNTAEFTFRPQGRGTVVTWAMYGEQNFLGKAFGLVFNMDKMLGGNFEQGLANLKAIAEAEAGKP